MSDGWTPVRFITEEIQVALDEPPALSKSPDAPDAFIWQGEIYRVEEVLSKWFDFGRRGRMARNMTPAHLRTAAGRGSWGVGRFYFRVRVSEDRAFDLYYDRAPESAGDRAGHWYLWRELKPG